MALKATIFKAALQVNDLDRHYYQQHALTLARHPSETGERLMVRVLAFALHAGPELEFGKGISSEEPALWQRDATGLIELIIELGLPDEQLLRRACGRARDVVVYTYGGRTVTHWWEKASPSLAKQNNLRVFEIAPQTTAALAALADRNMTLQCLIADGEAQILSGEHLVPVALTRRNP
ncbi:MAG: YaeQ family protein [Gammaproteobacteria bacterium]|nr:YaeQ family protein [Gammaproteobacteria bacterium]